MFRLTASLALALSLSVLAQSCSSSRVVTNQDPSADFGAYRTYGFVAELGTDTQEYGNLVTEFLKQATTRELESRGYRLAEEPDLLVNFYVHTQEKIQTSQTPTGGYYRSRRYGGYPGYETTVSQYTEGTLELDLVDSQRNQLVWEGVLAGRLTKKARANLELTIDQAMAEIFQEYPYGAGSSAPLGQEN